MSNDCVTEVTLDPSIPLHDVHHRLHRHLPSSPYFQGAIYLPIRDASRPLSQQDSRAVPKTKSSVPQPQPQPLPARILLLRGDFKWRFGGEPEQNSSPPWSWMSEELCGKPYPYIARDINCLSSTVSSASTPRFSAAYMFRLNSSSTVAFEYLQTIQLRALDGWLSDESYHCSKSLQSSSITNALPHVYVQNFDATVDLHKASILVANCLSMMELYQPDLQWHMATYRLEGSLQLHRIAREHFELPSIDQCQNSRSRQTFPRASKGSLLMRKRALVNAFHSPRVKTISPTPSTSPTTPAKQLNSTPKSNCQVER